MSDDRWVPWPQGEPTNEQVAELLGITTEEVGTYRLETVRDGNVWRVYLAWEILSSIRVKGSSETIPASLVLELPVKV